MRLATFLHLTVASLGLASAIPSPSPSPLPSPSPSPSPPTPRPTNITQALFDEFTSLSELVDIAYCVGTLNSGIDVPFTCLSYCAHFPSLTLIKTWNTGLKLSDSCGYIALSPGDRRIIVAFRGTYSLINALADLSLARQEYLPYPDAECNGCTVHAGFLESWGQTEKIIGGVLGDLLQQYPGYKLELVGHSLGAAVAALAALDFAGRAWNADIRVTTFGEPKGGNKEFAGFLDRRFDNTSYRRITHINDPVPLLPFESLGYHHHGHEYYISAPHLPCTIEDVVKCEGGAEDPNCVAGTNFSMFGSLMGHRDYFHRLGLCLPEQWSGRRGRSEEL